MCGIIAALNISDRTSGPMFDLLGYLEHRGPDANGYRFDETRTVYLGHTRLKIQDVNDSANQPFVSPCG
jgi:asparagine synthase (glutamine-hydrolysing)